MRTALAILVVCAGCGAIEPTNNGLLGRWTTVSDVGAIVMDLTPGARNVSGTATVTYVSDGHVGTYAVSTLPDERLHWQIVSGAPGDTAANDFHVKIVPYCPGETHPPANRVYLIDLDGLIFKRQMEAPFCSDFGA